MSTAAIPIPRSAIDAKLVSIIAAGCVGIGVFLSGFVLNEPAPYELFMAALIAGAAVFGLRIPASIAPLLCLLIVFNIGGLLSLTQMRELYTGPMYMAVSLFLALTSVFLAAMLRGRPELYRVIAIAWVISAMLTALAGIAGYFSLFPGAEVFTRYGRASGVFQDPNVFGPFLVLPGLYLLYVVLSGRMHQIALAVPALTIVVFGLFLSFSRGAWGLFSLSAMLLVAVLFLRSNSTVFRLRLVVLTMAAIGALAMGLLIALQIPAVGELFSQRAQLVQDYDGARLGRFARFGIGFLMATEKPFGIGPLNFGRIFGEDTHNIWLKCLMDYGWIGFSSFLTLTLWTLAAGFRILLRDRPWQPYLLIAYVAFAGHIALGTVIDIDHWRHFYLLLGMVWGGIALEAQHQSRAAARIPDAYRGGFVGPPLADRWD